MPQGDIRVYLKDHVGMPINGVVVVKKGDTVKSHMTAAGTYTFYDLDTGIWTVSAKHPTTLVSAGPKYVNVTSGDTKIKTLVLREETGLFSFLGGGKAPSPSVAAKPAFTKEMTETHVELEPPIFRRRPSFRRSRVSGFGALGASEIGKYGILAALGAGAAYMLYKRKKRSTRTTAMMAGALIPVAAVFLFQPGGYLRA